MAVDPLTRFLRRTAAGIQRRTVALRLVGSGVILCAAAALAVEWGAADEGHFDSAFYLDGARHIAQGEGYVSAVTPPDQLTYAPVIRWAPGFPSLVAIAIRLGQLRPLSAAALVLGVAYAVATVCVFLLGIELLGRADWIRSGLAAALFALQPATLDSLNSLLSDLPFAAIALLNTWLAVRLARARRASAGALLGYGGCLAMMVLARYAGALYIPGLLLAFAIAMRREGRSLLEIARAALLIVISFTGGVGLWVLRNRQYGPEPFGERALQRLPVGPQIQRALHGALSGWLQLADICGALDAAGWFRLGTLIAIVSCLALLFAPSRRRDGLLFTLLPSCGYLILMVWVATRIHFDSIDHSRFWVAIVPLLFLALLSLAAGAERLWTRLAGGVLSLLLTAALLAFLHDFRAELPSAQRKLGLLADGWRRAAKLMPDAGECRLFAMDARPFMLHRVLGPTSDISGALDDFDGAARRYPAVCIAVLARQLRLSSGAERQRPREMQLVRKLVAEGRVDLLRSGHGVTVYRLRP